ncbi:hypothetical protein B0H17DRAFT_1055510 [Mycena rosella]|uniref:RING-type domain-containing protein n=1 Tax=Mycena rosella TaxID=1033263 RepID=A0AAD7GI17_MYCRO|nr:hypothetical protein B0H17DRAFT_1055510 [Mycena rosella]
MSLATSSSSEKSLADSLGPGAVDPHTGVVGLDPHKTNPSAPGSLGNISKPGPLNPASNKLSASGDLEEEFGSSSNPPPDLFSDYLAQVLEIIPDVDPEYALSLVKQYHPGYFVHVAEAVIEALFKDPTYPKLDTKGKRKRVEDDGQGDSRGLPKARLEGSHASVNDSQPELGDGIECGCCFSGYPFERMIQCPDAHLFCSSCMTTYAETLLGSHDHKIICMDQSGCKLLFPYAELLRCLPPKLISLYERVKQIKEVEAAGIEGLEACPFCEYQCIIENPQQKLFACRNAAGGCSAVTCRQCKRLDHLPRSCKEMEQDATLDGRHIVEEAMTRAFKRECPNCQKAFIKVEGCNVITCPNCRAISCYSCRALITGHGHFSKLPSCNVFDDTKAIKAAANEAIEEYMRAHPDIGEEQLKVDLQLAPRKGGQNR